MTMTLLIQPTRFFASGGKLDSQRRYVFSSGDQSMGFVNGRTAYTAILSGGSYPGLNINGEEVTDFYVGGVGWNTVGLST